MKDEKPGFMVIYSCAACGQESGMTEKETPHCYYCDATEGLKEISRQEITPELMEARMKKLSENMFDNLLAAYENMTEEDKKHFAEGDDAEKEMLLMLDKAKKFRDEIKEMKLKNPEEQGND